MSNTGDNRDAGRCGWWVGQTLLPAGGVQLPWDSCNWPLPAFLELEGKQGFWVHSVCARQMKRFAFHLLLVAGNWKGKNQPEFVTHNNSESRSHLPGEQAAMKGCLIQDHFVVTSRVWQESNAKILLIGPLSVYTHCNFSRWLCEYRATSWTHGTPKAWCSPKLSFLAWGFN